MDRSEEIDGEKLLLQRTSHLIRSLSAMRLEDKADVVLVCEEKEFYAHKLVLEASSEYFVTMLNSGLQESQTGKIVFKEMNSETLDIILDFLYTGQLAKMTTDFQMKNVLEASHLMQIQDLFFYCWNTLMLKLSCDNFFDLFNLGKKYELQNNMSKMLKFWILNSQELLSTEQFLVLGFAQLKDFVQFLKGSGAWLDYILLRFFNWVQHDYEDRSKLAINLIDHIDFSLVTKQCIQLVLNSEDLVAMPKEFVTKLKEFSVSVLLFDDNVNVQDSNLGAEIPDRTTRLLLFSSNCNVEVFYPSKNCNAVARTKARYCFQQLDLITMTWHPVCDLNQVFCTKALCYYKQNLYAAGDGKVEICNPNNLAYLPAVAMELKSDSSICYFNGNIYVIGGHAPQRPQMKRSDIWYGSPNNLQWKKAVPLPFAAHPIVVLTTQFHIYVIDSETNAEIKIQYNSAPDKEVCWEVLYVSTDGGILTTKNFFVFENTLQALYLFDGKTVLLTFSQSEKNMTAKTYDTLPEEELRVTRVIKCITDRQIKLYVSTKNDTFRIPNFMWDPKTGAWSKLPDQSGKCELASASNSLVVIS